MAVMRLAAVAFGVVVAAAVVASPVAAQDGMAPFSAMADAASSMVNVMTPMDDSPLNMVAGLISQATSMTGPNGTYDDDDDTTCGSVSVSVRDEFFTVPEAFPDVDGEELVEGLGSYLEALPNIIIVAALSPLVDLADKGVFDPWLVAARRGLFDQVWFSVNIALGLGEQVINMVLEVLEFIGEFIQAANLGFLAFRQGELDGLLETVNGRDLLDLLMGDDGLNMLSRMASTHDKKTLATVASRMGEAHARLVTKVGRGPLGTVRLLAASYRERSAGGVAGMKARVRARASKPYAPRLRSFARI